MHAYWLSLARGPHGVRADGPDLKWSYTGSPVLNRVSGARFGARDADARIAAVVQRFRAWDAGIAWLTGPSTRPPDLGRRLEARGFAYAGAWTGMALDLAGSGPPGAPPAGLTIRAADEGAARRAWLDVIDAAFRLPPAARDVFHRLPGDPESDGDAVWHRYVGFLDGRPVASATLVGAAGTAGVYLVGTLPGARRRGLATALTRHVLAEARARGDTMAVLQATQTGRGLYRRLGFVEYGVIDVYRWTPPGQGHRRWLNDPGRLARLARLARLGGLGRRRP